MLVFVEYSAQIWKTFKTKTVEDISFTFWFVKILIAILQIVILYLTNNPLKVYLSQLTSLLFCLIVFGMCNYYHFKNKQTN